MDHPERIFLLIIGLVYFLAESTGKAALWIGLLMMAGYGPFPDSAYGWTLTDLVATELLVSGFIETAAMAPLDSPAAPPLAPGGWTASSAPDVW